MAVDNPSNLMPDQEIIIEGDAGFVPKASPSDAGKVLGVLNSSGDVGWVVDQSGTFIQVQADWAETDSSQPSYIDHKPDLSVYATASGVETALAGKQDTISDLSEIRAGATKGDTAVQPSTLESYATTSAMNTALAGKQDTISDLATIRSGASAGATAVQPATLESYATTSAMNTALASKQDTISDLSTIRAGAAAGATAAQPADLPSSDELVPSASSGDAGKVLTVDNQGNPGWVTPSAGTVYTPGDGIDITSDVISAKVDGTTIGIDSTTKQLKSLQTIPSVDQTYNASSTNAQSGTAVAQAIASIPSSSYTAGDGIKISSNTISADFEVVQPCLTFGSDFKFDNATQYTSTLSNNTRVSIPYNTACKFTLPGNLPRTIQTGMYGGTLRLQIVDPNGTEIQTLKSQYFSMGYMSVPIPENFYKDVDIPAISDSCYLIWQWLTTAATELTISNFDSTAYCFYVPYTGTLALTSPLPASTSADANKVLTVDSNGAAGWQNVPTPTVDEVPDVTSSDDGKVLTAAYSGGIGSYSWQTAQGGGSSYTAGDGIEIDNGEIAASVDDDTIDFVPRIVETTYTGATSSSDHAAAVPADVASAFVSQTPVSIKIHIPANTFSIAKYWIPSGGSVKLFVRDSSFNMAGSDVAVTYTLSSGNYVVDEQDLVVSGPISSWTPIGSSPVSNVTGVGFEAFDAQGYSSNYFNAANGSTVTYTMSAESPTLKSIAVKNPLPASAQADSGKVLKVNASGNAEWGTDSFTTTAGITDIQQVAALPANPVATVLYLIPET